MRGREKEVRGKRERRRDERKKEREKKERREKEGKKERKMLCVQHQSRLLTFPLALAQSSVRKALPVHVCAPASIWFSYMFTGK